MCIRRRKYRGILDVLFLNQKNSKSKESLVNFRSKKKVIYYFLMTNSRQLTYKQILLSGLGLEAVSSSTGARGAVSSSTGARGGRGGKIGTGTPG